jgi:hypothetical protein
VLKSYLTLHPSGIYALCAPLRPADADQISAEQVGRLLSPKLRWPLGRVPLHSRPGGHFCTVICSH